MTYAELNVRMDPDEFEFWVALESLERDERLHGDLAMTVERELTRAREE